MSQFIGSLRRKSQLPGLRRRGGVAGFLFRKIMLISIPAAALLLAGLSVHGSDDSFEHSFIPGALAVSRIQYDGNSFGSTETFPNIFQDPAITGIQGSIFIDQYLPVPFPGLPRLGTLPLTGITTSFSSKSEGALMRSVNGAFLTYNRLSGSGRS